MRIVNFSNVYLFSHAYSVHLFVVAEFGISITTISCMIIERIKASQLSKKE